MKKQQGITLIGLLLSIAVIVTCSIVIMRVVPVYIKYYSIVSSIKALNTTPTNSLTGDSIVDVAELRKSLTKRLDINGLEDLKPQELIITPNGAPNKFKVILKYQEIRPLVYNVFLMFNFERTDEVVAGSEN